MAGIKKTNYGTWASSITSITLMSLVWPIVFMRFFVRWHLSTNKRTGIGIDDWLCLLAAIFFTVCAALDLKLANYTFPSAITIEDIWGLIKLGQYVAINFVLTTIFIKLSIGFLFLRILGGKTQRILCIATMVLSTLINLEYLIFIIYLSARCVGHDKILGAYIGPKSGCNNYTADMIHLYLPAALNIFCDVIFMVLPLPPLLMSSLHWKTKLSGTVLVLFAGIATVCSAVRMGYLHQFLENPFSVGIVSDIITIIEPSLFIMLSCLATMRPLAARFFPSLRLDYHHSTESELRTYDTSYDTSEHSVPEKEHHQQDIFGAVGS